MQFHTRGLGRSANASAAEPRVANGPPASTAGCGANPRRYVRGRASLPALHEHAGTVRLLGFLNHTNSGSYSEALRQPGTPDVTATRKVGTLKYGAGLNLEQGITKDVGIFARLGWNDGKTESFAFTAIDRLLNAGISVNRRPLEASLRYRCRRADRGRTLRRACLLPRARRTRLPDR